DGRLRWPEDRGERTELARVLFGRGLAETYDVSLTDALDYLHNSAPHTPFERKNEAYEADTWLRTRLNTLSADQRHAVEVLLTDSLYGMIFSLLVSVDQPHEAAPLNFTISDDQGTSVLLGEPESSNLPELHDCLSDWLLSFSRFGDKVI